MLNLEIRQRILNFIKEISNICDTQMKNSVHYEYGYECLRASSSTGVARAVTNALRGCSVGGEQY
jgi:hypothetical protein